MKIFQLVCLVAAALVSSSAQALDGGPASGGGLSSNPNNRAPRTESATTDGGPMAGSSTSVNPNTRPDGGPSTTTTEAPATVTTKPATAAPTPPSADGGPPMSGGDMSTNPNLRPTTAPPTFTTKAPTPVPVTVTPSQTIGTVPPSSSDADDDATRAPAGTEPAEFDFSLINDDTKSAADDLIGEVNANTGEDSLPLTPSDSAEVAGDADVGEVAGDADIANEAETAPTSDQSTSAPDMTAATPSPVSKKNAVNSNGQSSATRTATMSVSGVVVATTAAVAVFAAVGL